MKRTPFILLAGLLVGNLVLARPLGAKTRYSTDSQTSGKDDGWKDPDSFTDRDVDNDSDDDKPGSRFKEDEDDTYTDDSSDMGDKDSDSKFKDDPDEDDAETSPEDPQDV